MNLVRKRWFALAALVAAAVVATTATWLGLRGSGRGSTRGGSVRSAGTTLFAALRARPLRVPAVPAGSCSAPIGPDVWVAVGLPRAFPAEGALGRGPVHPVSRGIPRFLDFFPPPRGSPLARSGWWSNETMWVSEPRYSGPVLVRGRMLHGSARVGFGIRMRPAWELHLPAGAWDEAHGPVRIWGTRIRPPKNWRVRRAYTRVLAASGKGSSVTSSSSTAGPSARPCCSGSSFSARPGRL
jgi:hypothetical protein